MIFEIFPVHPVSEQSLPIGRGRSPSRLLAVFDDPIRFAFEAKALDWTGGHDSWSGATFKEVLSKKRKFGASTPSFASETRHSCVLPIMARKRATAAVLSFGGPTSSKLTP